MNCCYSNLIEGHNTTPHEFERVLQDRLDAAEHRRDPKPEAFFVLAQVLRWGSCRTATQRG